MSDKRTATVSALIDYLDLDFYRTANADLSGLSDDELSNHYFEYGASEGRRPSEDPSWKSAAVKGKRLPADFVPDEYLRLNPDVAAATASSWEASIHYLVRGRIENREYTELDPNFYWEMYLSDEPYSLSSVISHFIDHGKDDTVFRSLEAMLAYHKMKTGRWLEVFSERAFALLNQAWVPLIRTRSQAIAVFLEAGLPAIAQISFEDRFDADFYRQLNPHLQGLPDTHIFRYWLNVGLAAHEAGSAEKWLSQHALSLHEFPKAFAWKEYAARHAADVSMVTPWAALQHLVGDVEADPRGWPLLAVGAADFLLALGLNRELQDRPDIASLCFERVISLGGETSGLAEKRGSNFYKLGQWAAAIECFSRFHASGVSTLWSVVLSTRASMQLGRFDEALATLSSGKDRFGGEQPWLDAARELIDAYFAERTNVARSLYSLGNPHERAEGDLTLSSATDWMSSAWLELLDMPAPLPLGSEGRVVMLCNRSLKQCTHYRVEQKAYLFNKLNRQVEIFDWSESSAFLAALPGAAAAIFYRLPAFPDIVKSILAAKSQNIPTYYEVDDLIFDAAEYPDALETFQGQIDDATYLGLLYGVPLYRSAMALCDYGIASTAALAKEMQKVVRTGRCFVLKNGLDSRNIGLDSSVSGARKPSDKIRIFYGSGTLAHNQDFNDYAGPALAHILSIRQDVELVIVGHLSLDERLSAFESRIIRVGIISDVQAYWSLLATADINLAVVAPGLVGDCKSEIKWLEAAVLSVPSVVSNTATYQKVIRSGENGMLADSPETWQAALLYLIEHPVERHRMADAARGDALSLYSIASGSRELERALISKPEKKMRSKPHVLVVNVFFPPQSLGGATRVVRNNIDDFLELAASEFSFSVATTDADASLAYSERIDSYRGVPVFRVTPPMEPDLDWKFSDPKMETWFQKVLEQTKPTLVHFHCIQRMTASIVTACINAAVPYIVTVHDGWWVSDYQFLFDNEGRVRKPGDELYVLPKRRPLALTLARLNQLRNGLERAEGVLAVSAPFTQIYRDAGFTNVSTVSNGLPPFLPAERTSSASGKVRIGHIGNTSAHKGFELVEAALRQGNYANLELLALSHGKRAEEKSEHLWGQTPVTIAGLVPQNKIGALYADLDVLLAPSIWPESYGLVTREAHAAGLWVVASDRGAIGTDVRPGVDGFVIDVSSLDDIVRVLSEINAEPERFRAPPPINVGQRTARSQAEDLLKIYRSTVKATGKERGPLNRLKAPPF